MELLVAVPNAGLLQVMEVREKSGNLNLVRENDIKIPKSQRNSKLINFLVI